VGGGIHSYYEVQATNIWSPSWQPQTLFRSPLWPAYEKPVQILSWNIAPSLYLGWDKNASCTAHCRPWRCYVPARKFSAVQCMCTPIQLWPFPWCSQGCSNPGGMVSSGIIASSFLHRTPKQLCSIRKPHRWCGSRLYIGSRLRSWPWEVPLITEKGKRKPFTAKLKNFPED
jgi:hypothetical protein